MIETLEEIEEMYEFKDGEKFVAMTVYNGNTYVASNRTVFKIVNDKLVPLPFCQRDKK